MAIEFFTGFEGCGSSSDIAALFTSQGQSTLPGYSATAGFNGSKCMIGHGRRSYHRAITTLTKTVCVGLHMRGTATNTRTTYGSANLADRNYHVGMLRNGDYYTLYNRSSGLELYKSSTLIASCSSFIPTVQTHIEIKMFSDATSGYIRVKFNGSIVMDVGSLDTGGGDWDLYVPGSGAYGDDPGAYLDNIFIADDWQGELYSVLLSPAADSVVSFSPLTGTDNYAMVDDAAQDGDTTYVESATVSDQDLYAYGDLDPELIPVAVSVVTVARKEGTGGRSLQMRAMQDATEYDVGGEKVLDTTYPDAASNPSMVTALATCPDTTAWTREKINAMQFGFKVSA